MKTNELTTENIQDSVKWRKFRRLKEDFTIRYDDTVIKLRFTPRIKQELFALEM